MTDGTFQLDRLAGEARDGQLRVSRTRVDDDLLLREPQFPGQNLRAQLRILDRVVVLIEPQFPTPTAIP